MNLKKTFPREVVFLKGTRIALRPLKPADADGPYAEWLNDGQVCRFNSHSVYPYTREDALSFIESARKSRAMIVLAIETLEQRRHVGNIALKDIDLFYRSAELAILIGDKACWGLGYGEEASKLLLRHAFSVLGLRRVGAGTFADNRGMRSLAVKLGMRQEGIRRKAAFKNGKFVDLIEFGLLKQEFRI
jgi:ribosomal-protein-alanine N-acetyltransferase